MCPVHGRAWCLKYIHNNFNNTRTSLTPLEVFPGIRVGLSHTMGGKVMLSDKFRVSLAHLQVNYIMSLRETARSHCNYGEDIFTRMHECMNKLYRGGH